jgi:hypothetical protein
MAIPPPHGPRKPGPPLRRLPAPRYRRLPPNDRFRTRLPGGTSWQEPPARRAVRLPLPVRLVLGAAIVALVAAVVYFGSGYLRPVADRFADFMGGFLGSFTAIVSSPTPPDASAAWEAPRLVAPDREVTNKDAVDVHGFVPAGVFDRPAHRVRIYVGGQMVAERPLPQTLDFTVLAVPLVSGPNRITATVVGPEGESPHSAPITVTLDAEPPPLRVATPKPGALVGGDRVQVAGSTEDGADVTVRNTTNGTAASAVAAGGAFAVEITLDSGVNSLVVTATDEAGNARSAKIDVRRGQSAATVTLVVSVKSLKISALPQPVTMTVTVKDARGRDINGALVSFGLSLPGLPTTTFEATTARGQAVWATTVPRSGVSSGTALVTVYVTLADGTGFRESTSFPIL